MIRNALLESDHRHNESTWIMMTLHALKIDFSLAAAMWPLPMYVFITSMDMRHYGLSWRGMEGTQASKLPFEPPCHSQLEWQLESYYYYFGGRDWAQIRDCAWILLEHFPRSKAPYLLRRTDPYGPLLTGNLNSATATYATTAHRITGLGLDQFQFFTIHSVWSVIHVPSQPSSDFFRNRFSLSCLLRLPLTLVQKRSCLRITILRKDTDTRSKRGSQDLCQNNHNLNLSGRIKQHGAAGQRARLITSRSLVRAELLLY